MHNEIDYSVYRSGEAKQRRACQDVLQWFNDAGKYRRLIRDLRGAATHEDLTLDQFRLMMSFGGVQGYPVTALWDRYIAPRIEPNPL